MFAEANDNEEGLDGHLVDGLADEGGDEEHCEGHLQMAARQAREVEQRVRDLKVILKDLLKPRSALLRTRSVLRI